MNKLLRILRHRSLGASALKRALEPAALQRLEAQVVRSEQRHGGEIRLCVETGLPWSYLWRGLGARERALTLFGKLGVWDTEANNGVLIYLLLADHAIEIVADRGLSRHVGAAQWQELVDRLSQALRAGQFEAGLASAIEAVGQHLEQHFARAAGEPNADELSNRVDLR